MNIGRPLIYATHAIPQHGLFVKLRYHVNIEAHV